MEVDDTDLFQKYLETRVWDKKEREITVILKFGDLPRDTSTPEIQVKEYYERVLKTKMPDVRFVMEREYRGNSQNVLMIVIHWS